jgi:hypothetical protein
MTNRASGRVKRSKSGQILVNGKRGVIGQQALGWIDPDRCQPTDFRMSSTNPDGSSVQLNSYNIGARVSSIFPDRR